MPSARAAQLNDTFCHCVDMRVQLAAEPVDHLVQRDEVPALDVPMRLLGQQRQIDRIGEAGIKDGDRNGLGIGWQIIMGLLVGHFRCSSHWRQPIDNKPRGNQRDRREPRFNPIDMIDRCDRQSLFTHTNAHGRARCRGHL